MACKQLENEKGITLIALIITIIVLIILSTVAINLSFGKNGIIDRAKQAKEETLKAQALEELKLKVLETQTEKAGKATLEDVINTLKNDKNNEYIISLDKIATINGTIPNVTNATEIFVVYKKYQFKINRGLTISLIDDYSFNTADKKDYIVYDANGGKNAPKTQTKDNSIISNQIPTREGYVFVGWGNSNNSTDILYKPNDRYNGENAITLYAVWREKVEYIQSNGIQYIDTEFYPNQDTSIEFVAETLEKDTTSAWFGSRTNTSSGAYILWNINNKFRGDFDSPTNNIDTLEITPNVRYTINMQKNRLNINGVNYLENPYTKFNSAATLTLFGTKTNESTIYNSENSVDYRMSELKLYSCKIWDNDNLVRDFKPIKDVNDMFCLFDTINYKYYYFENVLNRIDYIESDGTQYIDTKVYPNQDTKIEFVAESTEDNTTVSAWFGSRTNPSSGAYALWNINNKFRGDIDSFSNNIDTLEIASNVRYTINMQKNELNINGVNYLEKTFTKFNSTATLTLFGIKTNASTWYNSTNSVDYRMSKLKLYSCKIWVEDNLVRDYVPIKDLNGEIALYDKIDKQIYYNAGTGTFKYDN